jgi:hypothetical protein
VADIAHRWIYEHGRTDPVPELAPEQASGPIPWAPIARIEPRPVGGSLRFNPALPRR